MENSFEIGEIVLGKVKGYPYWPGIITRKKGKSPKTVYTIKFFGDHSFSAIKKKYIKKYQMDFVDKKLLESNINMKQSIEEAEDALLFLVQEKNTKNQINIEIEVDFNYNYKINERNVDLEKTKLLLDVIEYYKALSCKIFQFKNNLYYKKDALYYHFIKKDLDFLTKSVQFLKTFTFCLDFVSNTKIGIMIDYMHKNLDPNKKENQNLIQQLQSLIQKIKSDCQ